jgi:glycosyltransferase involved in cell wall biosynthesis
VTGLSRPIPILLSVRELNYGGIERDVTKIALKIDATQFQPHVASYQPHGMRFEELKAAGIPFLHLPVASLRSPTTLYAVNRLRQYIRQHRIRLVHAYDASAVFVAPVSRAMRLPAVLSSTLGYRDLLDPRTRRQARWTDKIVDAIVVNCEAMRRHMIDDEHVAEEKVELCYNGVDTNQFHPSDGERSRTADASVVVGAICVLRPEKALDLLQEGFARIRHLRPGIKLRIVGSGLELSRLEANVRRLGLEQDCQLMPATREVPEILRDIDIFVLPSRSEAFSNGLLEAMACGCAVVGSRVGGTPELIGNDERGLLFESGNAQDLASKLSNLILNKTLRRELGFRASEFARKKLSIEIAARRMADIYEGVLQRKRSC